MDYSGTGSSLIELLLRYHVDELVLIDVDKIDFGNLNRLFVSRLVDAGSGTLKIEPCSLSTRNESPTLSLSIWRSKGCRSFFLRNAQIVWCWISFYLGFS